MITLIEGYEIHGNAHDYSLVIRTQSKKTGKEAIKTVGYYRNVSDCVVACYKDICRKVVRDKAMTLEQAVAAFQAVEKRLEAIIPDCFKVG